FFFFFSSRRRHTRSKRDWSSDVCSSDLANSTPSALGALNATKDIPILFTSVTDAVDAGLVDAMDEPGDNITGVVDLHPDGISKRSEERRVGKECRYRGGSDEWREKVKKR